MKTIGEKIRAQRESLNLTQIELAKQIGVTNRTITSYERNVSKPRGYNISKLCSALHVSEAYLLNAEIEDPAYGIEESPYVEAAREAYGKRGATDMQKLLEANQAVFAGGDIPQEDKDKFFEAVMQAYVLTKNKAREQFTPKSKR